MCRIYKHTHIFTNPNTNPNTPGKSAHERARCHRDPGGHRFQGPEPKKTRCSQESQKSTSHPKKKKQQSVTEPRNPLAARPGSSSGSRPTNANTPALRSGAHARSSSGWRMATDGAAVPRRASGGNRQVTPSGGWAGTGPKFSQWQGGGKVRDEMRVAMTCVRSCLRLG
jgi:hypothetical protein